MLRVGIFTDNDFEKVNGVTTTLRAALEHAPADVRLRIYTCDSAGADTPTYFALRAPGVGIPYYSEMKMYVPPFRRLLRQAEQDRLDVIHLTTPGPLGLTAMWVASRLRLPMVGSFHTHLAEYTARLSGSRQLGALMHQYMRWPYGKCVRVLAPSESTRQLLIDGRVAADRIGLWERGVSTTRFDPALRSDALRTTWAVSDHRPAVLYVGRLSREKGLSELLAVRRGLLDRAIPHRFIFVGDGPMRFELESCFSDAVFTGTVSPAEVAVAMASSDLFVFPSRTDTAGNVVLEAQASGLPVLVTDEGGPRENMRDGETGVVCGSTREMCRQVLELCARSERRRALGRGARLYAQSRGWAQALAPLYRAYRDAAASRTTLSPMVSRIAAA